MCLSVCADRELVKCESFGWILLNSEFICVVGTVSTYLEKWGKIVNFGNSVAEIQQKYEREREKVGERKQNTLVLGLCLVVLGSLDQDSMHFGLGLQIVTLHLLCRFGLYKYLWEILTLTWSF